MLKLILFLISMHVFFLQFYGQISFQKQYGGSSTGDYGHSVIQAPDSGYFIAGGRVNNNGTNFTGEGLLLRTDKYGNEVWINYYSAPGSNDLEFDYIEKTSDNKLVVTGVVNYGVSNNEYDLYLSKIDTNGAVIWFKNYGGQYRQRGLQVKETFDNGYIIGGWNEVYGNAGSISFYLIKTNSIGDTIWTRAYPYNTMWQTGLAVEQTPDSGYVMVGTIDLPLQIGTDMYIMKFNSEGDTLWTKIIDFPGTGKAMDVKISNGGNIIISGWISPSGCAEPIIAEIDQSGNIQWINSYNTNTGFCEWNYSLCNTNDNGYAIFGMDSSSDYFLLKTDSAGNEQWHKKFDEGITDYGYNLRQANDGGFIMTGITVTNANINVILIKTDETGNILTGLNELLHDNQMLIFPNPAIDKINIHFTISLGLPGKFKFEIIDLTGRIVYEEILYSDGEINITLPSDIANGIYNCIISSDKFKAGKKLVVVRD